MENIILNDGKTKQTAIKFNRGWKEDMGFIPEILDIIKKANGYATYSLTDQVTEKDEYGYDQIFILYTFYKENEARQCYEKCEIIWFDVTGPMSDYD